MRDYERLALAAVLGAIAAYFAGLAVQRWNGYAAVTVTFVIEMAALFLGWLWADRTVRR